MASFSTISVENRSLGTVKVKVDSEDKNFLIENGIFIHMSTEGRFYTRLFENGRPGDLGHRAVLMKHNHLDITKNTKPKNGDHFDLRKKNWI